MTPVTAVQQQARALGDPTRYALYKHIADAGRPVGIAELTERFPFNHNAIRQHLTKLLGARLIVESKAAATGRGRPRLLYTVNPAVGGHWGTTNPYERLSAWLAEIIRTGVTPKEVGRRAAQEFRAASRSGDVVTDVNVTMARQGFDPELRPTRDGGTEIVLHNCPFESAAEADRDTVCSIHLGLAEGLTDGTNTTIEELVAYDPRRAGCRLRMRTMASKSELGSPGGTLVLRRRPAKP
jgi:predicted ArsR family transcriptional regulator